MAVTTQQDDQHRPANNDGEGGSGKSPEDGNRYRFLEFWVPIFFVITLLVLAMSLGSEFRDKTPDIKLNLFAEVFGLLLSVVLISHLDRRVDKVDEEVMEKFENSDHLETLIRRVIREERALDGARTETPAAQSGGESGQD